MAHSCRSLCYFVSLDHIMSLVTLRYDAIGPVMMLASALQRSVVPGTISDYLKAVSHTVSRVQASTRHNQDQWPQFVPP